MRRFASKEDRDAAFKTVVKYNAVKRIVNAYFAGSGLKYSPDSTRIYLPRTDTLPVDPESGTARSTVACQLRNEVIGIDNSNGDHVYIPVQFIVVWTPNVPIELYLLTDEDVRNILNTYYPRAKLPVIGKTPVVKASKRVQTQPLTVNQLITDIFVPDLDASVKRVLDSATANSIDKGELRIAMTVALRRVLKKLSSESLSTYANLPDLLTRIVNLL